MAPVQKKSIKKPISGPIEAESKKTIAAKIETGPSSVKASLSAKRVRDYKRHAKKELSEAFPEIVGVLIERAKKGSLTHAKFLFEIGGVKDERLGRVSRKRHVSLAEILLNEVAKRGEEAADVGEPQRKEALAQQHEPRTADTRSEDKR